MREILFRAKCKDNSEWVYGSLLIQAGERINKDELTPVEYRILGCRGENHLVDPKTVGEYTGLTDGKGTRIFEGDIIQNIESGETGEIQYFPEHTAFLIFVRCSVIDSRCYLDYLGKVNPSILKVIGNVHDNPDLIKA